MRKILGTLVVLAPAAGALLLFSVSCGTDFPTNPGVRGGDYVIIKDDDHRLVRAGAICIGKERGQKQGKQRRAFVLRAGAIAPTGDEHVKARAS